jgi:hypothetical protein
MVAPAYENVYTDMPVNPGTITTATTSYYDVSDYDSFEFLVAIGATDGTVAGQVVQATASDGTGSKNITSSAITTLSATDDNKFATIETEVSKLDINNSFRYVALTYTVAGTTTGCVFFRGYRKGQRPVTQAAKYDSYVFLGG